MIYILVISVVFNIFLISRLRKAVRERNNFFDRYLDSFYKWCVSIRASEKNMADYQTLCKATLPMITDDNLKQSYEGLVVSLERQHSELEPYKQKAEEFMTEYEIQKMMIGG